MTLFFEDIFLIVIRYQACGVRKLTTAKFHAYVLQHWNTIMAILADDKQFEVVEIIRKHNQRKRNTEILALLREIPFVISDNQV